MDETNNNNYVTPATRVYNVRQEGAFCASAYKDDYEAEEW